jgi:hypothetical protein
MNIPVTSLPSGGYGYDFPSVNVSPMTFQEIIKYLEGIPEDDNLAKYMYDINMLIAGDPNIKNCYIMDIDFLLFYKKLITVSSDLTYTIHSVCPECGKKVSKTISLDTDLKFEQIDRHVMEGATIELGGHMYETIVPRYTDFMKVFQKYLVYRRVTDLGIIKTIALIKDFDLQGNQIESDVLGAKHEDITLILMLQELYYNQLKPIKLYCPDCNAGKPVEERREMAISVDSLISDFFREISINCPIDGSKVLFKQVREM